MERVTFGSLNVGDEFKLDATGHDWIKIELEPKATSGVVGPPMLNLKGVVDPNTKGFLPDSFKVWIKD